MIIRCGFYIKLLQKKMDEMECENDAIHPRFQLKPDIYRSGTVFKVVLNIITLTFVSWPKVYSESRFFRI